MSNLSGRPLVVAHRPAPAFTAGRTGGWFGPGASGRHEPDRPVSGNIATGGGPLHRPFPTGHMVAIWSPESGGAETPLMQPVMWPPYGVNMAAMRAGAPVTLSSLQNAVAIANGKGGVGKTSITANVAGTAALSGWRVLAVDLDPQGNLGNDLGYNARKESDDGQGMLNAVLSGEPLKPLVGVRERLDVVPGGEALDELTVLLTAGQPGDSLATRAVLTALAPIAHRYQLILIDCPPAAGVLLDAAMVAVRFLVIPTRRDSASLDGFVRVARRFAGVRAGPNPELELLGVVLFDFGGSDRRMLAATRAELERDLDGAARVFHAFIRNSRRAPGDMRDRGMLAYEYEEAAATATPWYKDRHAPRFSPSAAGLAEDYQRLTAELLSEINVRRGATQEDFA